MSQLLFFTLSAMTILSALVVVFTRKPMYSVLSLIVCFFTIAGHYILLNAQFLAITHIIVYAAGMLFITLLASIKSTTLGDFAFPPASDKGLVQHVGQRLFTDYLLPFEISSILFLSAMIGAVVLAKKEKH